MRDTVKVKDDEPTAKFRKVDTAKLPFETRQKFNVMQEVYKKYSDLRHEFEEMILARYHSKIPEGHTIKFGYYWGTLSIKIVPEGPAPKMAAPNSSIEDLLDDACFDEQTRPLNKMGGKF